MNEHPLLTKLKQQYQQTQPVPQETVDSLWENLSGRLPEQAPSHPTPYFRIALSTFAVILLLFTITYSVAQTATPNTPLYSVKQFTNSLKEKMLPLTQEYSQIFTTPSPAPRMHSSEGMSTTTDTTATHSAQPSIDTRNMSSHVFTAITPTPSHNNVTDKPSLQPTHTPPGQEVKSEHTAQPTQAENTKEDNASDTGNKQKNDHVPQSDHPNNGKKN